MKAHTAVVVPAHNCGRTVADVVRGVRTVIPESIVLVIDDGSTDDTADQAEGAGAVVLSHLHNRGKGAAIRTGLARAVRSGAQFILTLDGDGQHAPEDARAVLHACLHTDADVVVGNRMKTALGMPFDRRLSNRLSSLVVSIACQQRVPDSQCGLRAFRTWVVRKAPLQSNYFEIETELLLAAAKQGAKIASVPVRSVYSGELPPSHVRRLTDTARFLLLLLRWLVRWT